MPGPIESIFGDGVAPKIIDLLAMQINSQTLMDITRKTGLKDHEAKNALGLLLNNNLVGLGKSHSTESEYSYYIRTDNPGGKAIMDLYNYFNSLSGKRIALYSSDVSVLNY